MKPWRELQDLTAAQELGAKLGEARLASGLSINQLAQASGVSHESIRGYERGDRFPYVDSLMKLAATLQVPIEDLLPEDYMERFRLRGLVVLEGKVEALRRGLLSSVPSSPRYPRHQDSEDRGAYVRAAKSVLDRAA